MENASKALIIAGGILIAVMIIGVLMYTMSTSSNFLDSQQKVEQTEQLKAFNNQYEAYNKKLLRGTDVISVINKVIDNNTKYGVSGLNETGYIMNVEFEMKESIVYTKEGTASVNFKVGERYNQSSFSLIKNNQEAFNDFKRRIFDCAKVEYNKTTGRVKYMLFIERKMSTNEYETGL